MAGVSKAMATKKQYKKSDGKEAFRLWFEFLKRAIQDKSVKINKSFYKEWGDIENTKFNDFWAANGDMLAAKKHVELANNKITEDCLLVSVPLDLTPTQAANELRALLMEHYKSIKHKSIIRREYSINAHTEIKVSSYRAYLHTYDAQQRLLENNSAVTIKELLEEVRRFYLARTEKWSKSKRKVESIPAPLLLGMKVNPVTGKVVNYSGEEKEAVRAVKRYLVMANQIIANVAIGKFPN